MIYELRTYVCLPRKITTIVEVMEKLMPVFEKNGIRVVGMWTTLIGRAEEFVYLLEFESLADREKKMAKYMNDPDLAKVFQEYVPNVQFHDNVILQPTEYSPLR